MKPKKPRDPVPGERHSLKQVEKDGKIFDNLVELFMKENKENIEKISRDYLKNIPPEVTDEINQFVALFLDDEPLSEEEIKIADDEFVEVQVQGVAQALVSLWINILWDTQRNQNKAKLKLQKNLLPTNDALENPPSVKEYLELCVCADFNLTKEQAIGLLKSFANKVEEEVEKTSMVQLPLNLCLKKDSEGFFVTKQQ